jgi:dTDP-glucose pyrophosphorylase
MNKSKFQDILVAPDISIREVLDIIELNSSRIAIVVDQDHTILGVVTDGDIRRGLLSGLSLKSNVHTIMNASPLIMSDDVSREEILLLAKSRGILAVPVTENGKFKALVSLYETEEHHVIENPVFIMAGGFGTRLRPLTDNCPKPMLPINQTPLLEIVIKSFIRHGFVNFYISTHYLADVVTDYFGDGSNWGVNIQYVHESKPLGTGGALGLLPAELIKSSFIMVNGDILTNLNWRSLLDFHNKSGAIATMCLRKYEYSVPYGVVESQDGRVTQMVEKPTQYFDINAGVYAVSPELLRQIEPDEVIDMPTILEKNIDAGSLVSVFPLHESWIDIGRKNDLLRAEQELKSMGLD